MFIHTMTTTDDLNALIDVTAKLNTAGVDVTALKPIIMQSRHTIAVNRHDDIVSQLADVRAKIANCEHDLVQLKMDELAQRLQIERNSRAIIECAATAGGQMCHRTYYVRCVRVDVTTCDTPVTLMVTRFPGNNYVVRGWCDRNSDGLYYPAQHKQLLQVERENVQLSKHMFAYYLVTPITGEMTWCICNKSGELLFKSDMYTCIHLNWGSLYI